MARDLLIGCTTGVFYPHTSLAQSLRELTAAGIRVIELGQNYASPETDDWLEITKEDLAGVEHLSLHAPAMPFDDSEETHIVFRKVEHLMTLAPLSHVVVHPDVVTDYAHLREAPFPIAIENMDVQRQTHQGVEELREVFNELPHAQMVLDVNHVFTVDPTMQRAHELYEAFGERIAEIHVSGYDTLHDPLFKTKQDQIIRAIEDSSVPLIIESQMEHVGDVLEEVEYIRSVISSYV